MWEIQIGHLLEERFIWSCVTKDPTDMKSSYTCSLTKILYKWNFAVSDKLFRRAESKDYRLQKYCTNKPD